MLAVNYHARGIWAGYFVWAVWGALVVTVTIIVHFYAVEPPFGDDWLVTVPLVDGERHFSLRFLWEQNNEHRIVIPKLIDGILALVTHGWFKAENFANMILLAATAAWMLHTARRLRGRHSFADAFIPLVILQPGYGEIWTVRMEMDHVMSAVLTCGVLSCIATHRSFSASRAVLSGALLAGLPLCNSSGTAVAFAGIMWLAWLARRKGRSPDESERREARRMWIVTALPVAIITLHFVTYIPLQMLNPYSVTPKAALRAALQALSSSLVPWTLSSGRVPLCIVPVILMAGTILLIWIWRHRPMERERCAGFLLLLGALAGVALCIGWGRGGFGPFAGTAPRYGLVLMPMLLSLYYASICFGPLRSGEFLLFALAAFALPARARDGLIMAKGFHHSGKLFLQDLANKAPAEYLVRRYCDEVIILNSRRWPAVEHSLERLRKSGISPFAKWHKPPRSVRVPFAANPAFVNQMTWDGSIGEANGPDPYLVFNLDHPRRILGIELRFILEKDDGAKTAMLESFWARGGISAITQSERNAHFPVKPGPAEQTVLIWINDKVDCFRFDPDTAPSRFTIRGITLLEPDASPRDEE